MGIHVGEFIWIQVGIIVHKKIQLTAINSTKEWFREVKMFIFGNLAYNSIFFIFELN